MSFCLADLAKMVGGSLQGDGSVPIHAALPLEEAKPGSITLITDRKRFQKLKASAASAVVTTHEFAQATLPAILVDDPLAAILQIAAALAPRAPTAPSPGVDPRAVVHETVRIGTGVSIGPFAVVEANVVLGDRVILRPHVVVRAGSSLGADVEIHSHAVLYPGTIVGERSIIHAGAVIGCDGFGYKTKSGKHQKVPQIGHVEIGPDVEIGAGATIDRATFGTTRVGEGTKIDNLVMIGHNTQIGKHNILVSHVGVSGSVTTGDYVVMAGKVGVADHVHVGAGAVLGASSGVHADIPAGQVYLGTPARPERETKRLALLMEKLPEMRRQLAEIRAHLGLARRGESDLGAERREAG